MRTFGLITLILCSCSILFFLLIAVFGESQFFIPSLIPLPVLILQLLLIGHTLHIRPIKRNPIQEVILDKSEDNQKQSTFRYKICAILLSFVSILAISTLAFVLIINNDTLIHYGMWREIFVSKCLIILGSISASTRTTVPIFLMP